MSYLPTRGLGRIVVTQGLVHTDLKYESRGYGYWHVKAFSKDIIENSLSELGLQLCSRAYIAMIISLIVCQEICFYHQANKWLFLYEMKSV